MEELNEKKFSDALARILDRECLEWVKSATEHLKNITNECESAGNALINSALLCDMSQDKDIVSILEDLDGIQDKLNNIATSLTKYVEKRKSWQK